MSIRNFDALFSPRSIALIGASNTPGSVGQVIAANLLGAGFEGPILCVNPHARAVASTHAYRSIAELPVVPDLAVIATPAASVPGIVAELGQRGCRAAVVVSAGFEGKGTESDLRQRLLDAARPHLMRIVGPNCLGLISTPRAINASFAQVTPRPGGIALVSQSGAIIAAMLGWAQQRQIGFSHVMSLGDMSDVDFGDALDYLGSDAATRAILLYVENITHARKFMSAARAAARAKPVLVVKSGRSSAGAKAALSHTGALAGSDAVYDAAFRRAGLLRVHELDELFAAAAILASGVRVSGDRLTILTNGGGAGVLAVDALAERGLQVAELGAESRSALDLVLPHSWSHGNPVDILGDATAERYGAALAILMREPASDAILAINCPTALADGAQAARAVATAAVAGRNIPVLANWLGSEASAESHCVLREGRVPSFDSPEQAVRAFGHLVEFRRNQTLLLETPSAGVMLAPAAVAAAGELIAAVRHDGRALLNEQEAKRLLALLGIPTVETCIAGTPAEAGRIAQEIGGPVALKILSPDITHKSDVGGVALGLASGLAVQREAEAMLGRVRQTRPEARALRFTVQAMISRPHAQELIVGIAHDATFGPVILFGQGGTAAEVMSDRSIGLPPLNSVLAGDMVAHTRVARLLGGFRNVPPVRPGAIEDVLLRLSEITVHLPDVLELDINPLLADASGVIALDARIVIAAEPVSAGGYTITPYPQRLERAIVLTDGTPLELRPIRPEDEVAITAMVGQCTAKDLRMRFLGSVKRFEHDLAARLSQIDYHREMAFVAIEPGLGFGEGPIYGVVRIAGDPERSSAEFAILVRSDMKGRGLGFRLLSEIVGYARQAGYRTVYGDVLNENAAMLRMAGELGFVVESGGLDSDTKRVTLSIEAGTPSTDVSAHGPAETGISPTTVPLYAASEG